MAVSCDRGLIDGVSGTQAEKRRASHCLFLPSASWKTDMETSYGNTERWDKSGKTTLPLEKNLPRPWQTSGIVPRVYLKTDEAGCLGSLFEGSVLRSCSHGLNPSMTGQFVCGGLQKSPQSQNTYRVLIALGCLCSQELRCAFDRIIWTSKLKVLNPGLIDGTGLVETGSGLRIITESIL